VAIRGEGWRWDKIKMKERESGLEDRKGERKRETRALRLENASYVKVI